MIPFLDLKSQNGALRREIDAAIRVVVDSSEFCLGSSVEDFEQAFSEFCGVRHAIGVNSGTSALHLALLALDIGPGKEVITVASTFVATVAVVRYVGATPVLVDIDPGRFTLDPQNLAAAITPRTAAIVPVHLYGQMADMGPILRVADERGIPVIEDAAQAHGATYHNRPAGSMGRIGCFSFYPGKILGAFGEGGAIVTDDNDLARRMRAMRDWGQFERAVHHYPCFNYRMEGIQGAVLGVKLKHLPDWTEQRQSVARSFDDLFEQAGAAAHLLTPAPARDGVHAYHQYAIQVDDRDLMRQELTSQGIQTGVHYPLPVHLQPGFSDLGYARGSLPHSEHLALTTLSLPIYPELASADQEIVVDRIMSIAARRQGRRLERTRV